MLKIILLNLLLHGGDHLLTGFQKEQTEYVCPPCAHDRKTYLDLSFKKDGQCHICQMNLIELNSITSQQGISIHTGSGNFYFKSRTDSQDTPIQVFYHKPETFKQDSDVLLVITGSGRDAWDYRDAWVELAEEHEVLVLVPWYPVEKYGFNHFHLINLVDDLSFKRLPADGVAQHPNKIYVDEESIKIGSVNNPTKWLTHDFDQLFIQVKEQLSLSKNRYQVFGHSAGAQIIHRWAMFAPSSLVEKMVAANAGFYTSVDDALTFPLGLRGVESRFSMQKAFNQQLILMVGASDNFEETRGTMLHTVSLDRKGLGRLERAGRFYQEVSQAAERNHISLKWTFHVVPGVGHEHSKMAQAASRVLFAEE